MIHDFKRDLMPQSPTSRSGRWPPSGLQRWMLTALLAALPLQLVPATLRTSMTTDELAHLPAGYAYLHKQDFRMNVEHPPFVKELAALPILFFNPGSAFESVEWASADQYSFGRLFLFEGGRPGELMLFLGRLPIVVLSILFGWVLSKWAAEWYGFGGALIALTLYVFSPNILAHSHLVTFDLAVGFLYFTAVFCFRHFLARPSWRSLLFSSGTAALASLAKFSGALIYPCLWLLLLWAWQTRTFAFASLRMLGTVPWLSSLARQPFAMASLVVMTFVVTWLLLSAAVYMSFEGPIMYWHGASQVYANRNPYYLFYLNGRFYNEGVWFYSFFAMMLKTPLPTLLCILLGFATVFLNRDYDRAAWLLIPVLVFAVPTLLFSLNLGLRYLLPIYPYLFLFAASLWGSLGRRAAGRWAIGLILTASILEGLLAWPHHLSYFNSAARTRKAFHWLDDSNLDWGQGYIDLRAYLKRHRIERPVIRFFSPDPALYGIDYIPFDEAKIARTDPGIYIVSTHYLNREPSLYWLRHIEPLDVVAKVFHVYRLDSEAYQKAFEIYDEMVLRDEPNFLPEFGLATLYHRRGDLDLADEWYGKAIQKATESGLSVPGLLLRLGTLRLEQGNLIAARLAFEASLEHEPSFAGYHNLALLAIAEKQDFDAAMRLWQTGSRYARGKAEAILVNLKIGAAFLQQGSPSRAEPHFRQALVLDPRNTDAIVGLAESQRIMGRLNEAIGLYREAMPRHPDNPDLRSQLGLLLMQAGRTTEARAYWEEALRLSPGHPEATRLLRQAAPKP